MAISIIFCLPGSSFSRNFLLSWTNLLAALPELNVKPLVKGAVSSNVYLVRNLCLGGELPANTSFKPFGGKLQYDYLMWLDSDMVFEPEDFATLFHTLEKKPQWHILSGLAYFANHEHFIALKHLHPHYLKKNHQPRYLTEADIVRKRTPFKVFANGMYFTLVRYGVFESLTFPWFDPAPLNLSAKYQGFSGEDVNFCLKAKDQGFATYVHPKVILGHEKSTVLYPDTTNQ